MVDGAAVLQQCLQRLGAKRVEAALLAALLEHGAMATQKIVDRTGLRQPEVSVGMRMLRERGWVDAEPLPRKGKGRPMHRYHLTADAAEIRDHFEEQARLAIKTYQEALAELQHIT